MGTLQQLAGAVGADERTLRRAVSLGTVHGHRPSPRRLLVEPAEWDYLSTHWELLGDLRELFRTEPRIRFAALFGSVARGGEQPDSDLDLLVSFAQRDARGRRRLLARVEQLSGRPAQLVHLEDAERAPFLLAEIIRDGRVIVDRDGAWPGLVDAGDRIRRAGEDAYEAQLRDARTAIDRLSQAAQPSSV